MHYMQAHGYSSGPTQRPTAAGTIAGGVAALVAYIVLHLTGALDQVAANLRVRTAVAIGVYLALCILGGVLYGRIFQRTVNDRRGGWLFGTAYGFLLWLIGPVAILQWATNMPIVTGSAATGVLAANLVFGLVLGLTYPWVHRLVQRKLYDVFREAQQKRPAFHEGKRQLDLRRAPA